MTTPVVLITGALTGIGRATALAFAHEGARIVVSGRRDEAGQALAAELRGLGAEVEFVRTLGAEPWRDEGGAEEVGDWRIGKWGNGGERRRNMTKLNKPVVAVRHFENFSRNIFLENNFVVHFIVRNFSGVDCTSRRTRRAFDGHLTE
jgi:hypothetical protein